MHSKKQLMNGISIRNLHAAISVIILIVSILLLITTYHAKTDYSKMRDDTAEYISWQASADNLQKASDYLTEQARCFAETGKREYLDNYFNESKAVRRRERAIETIGRIMGDSPAYEALSAAMEESVILMSREYYAMRLTIAAYGYDYRNYPEEIQRVELQEADALLSPEEQDVLARKMVFDDVYHQRKETISKNVRTCLASLETEINAKQKQTTESLDDILMKERSLIIFAIIVMLVAVFSTLLLVISPLIRAVFYIRADEPIPIRGSKEFQFLARTYNLMYESNQEKREQLAYEATHDQLTGIYNRSGYVFFLNNTDWETSGLLLFDVDKFKQINDVNGHEMGDKALKKVAETLRQSFRSQDHICRIGGDEFAVIMVHTGPEHATLAQTKVRRINEILAKGDGDLPPIHLSCGLAYGAKTQDIEKLFKMADAALYRVKRAGGCGCEIGE